MSCQGGSQIIALKCLYILIQNLSDMLSFNFNFNSNLVGSWDRLSLQLSNHPTTLPCPTPTHQPNKKVRFDNICGFNIWTPDLTFELLVKLLICWSSFCSVGQPFDRLICCVFARFLRAQTRPTWVSVRRDFKSEN